MFRLGLPSNVNDEGHLHFNFYYTERIDGRWPVWWRRAFASIGYNDGPSLYVSRHIGVFIGVRAMLRSISRRDLLPGRRLPVSLVCRRAGYDFVLSSLIREITHDRP